MSKGNDVAAASARVSVLYTLCRHFFRIAFRLYFRWRPLHPERIPPAGSCILAANHASYVDPPLIGTAAHRHVSMLARSSLFRFPVFGSLLRAWGAVPVDPDGGASAGLRVILERLRADRCVLIFPEGTRTATGALLPGRSGVGLAAIKSGAPVVPVRIWGSFQAYGRDIRIPRPCRVILKFGHPMTFDDLREEARSCGKARLKEIYQEVSDRVMRAIADLEPSRDRLTFP